MGRCTGVTTLLALASVLCLGAEAPEAEPLVRVNGHVITTADLERSLRLQGAVAEQERLPGPPDAEYEQLRAQRRKDALQGLIDRQLLLQKARKEYLGDVDIAGVMDALAEDQFERVCEQVGSRLRLQHLLSQSSVTVKEFKRRQAENLLINKLLLDEVYATVHVSPAQIRRYYREHRDEFTVPRTIVYRQMFFPVVGSEELAPVRRKAAAVRRQILQGAEFARLADEHSADADRYPGGLHEVAVPEQQGDWVPPAVEGLEPGQLSEVRRVSGGLAIVRLEEIRPAHVLPFEQVQSGIREELLQAEKAEAYNRYVARLRERAVLMEYPAASEMGL